MLYAPNLILAEIGAHEHRRRCHVYKDNAVWLLCCDGLASEPLADRARGQYQCLFDDVVFDLVEKHRDVCVNTAPVESQSQLVVHARLGLELLDLQPCRNGFIVGCRTDHHDESSDFSVRKLKASSNETKSPKIRQVQ